MQDILFMILLQHLCILIIIKFYIKLIQILNILSIITASPDDNEWKKFCFRFKDI